MLLFVAMTGILMLYRPAYNLRQIALFSPLLILPLLAVISTTWSEAPQSSMRAGLELCLTVGAAILVCRNVRAEWTILTLFGSFALFAAQALPYVPFALATKTPLVAGFGSKNQVGFVGFMLFALSIAVIVDRSQRVLVRLAAIAAVPYALLLGWLSQSGGTTASVALVLLIFPPLAILGAIKLPVRIALIALTLALVGIASFFLDDIDAAVTDFRVHVLNKDATLTGRTYLWDFAARLSAARPYLGYGYGSFWRQGNIDAEGLWRWGGIANRGGFNFHNAFVEIRVDLGLVGMSLLLATCVIVAVVAVVRQILKPSVPLACLIAIMAVTYFRSYVENGLFAPFSLTTVVWMATLLYAFPVATRPSPVATATSRDLARDEDVAQSRASVRPVRSPVQVRKRRSRPPRSLNA